LSLLLLGGCVIPGGGGSQQTVPDTIRVGEAALIRFELTANDIRWAPGRFRDVKLLYRLVGDSTYRSLQPSNRRLVEAAKEAYEFVIPPFAAGTAGQLEYYFTLTFDGHQNEIQGYKKIPVE
jgi:hypothetical protein